MKSRSRTLFEFFRRELKGIFPVPFPRLSVGSPPGIIHAIVVALFDSPLHFVAL